MSSKPSFISPYLSSYLDLFRWLAAFAVVLTHVKHRFLVEWWADLESVHKHGAMKAFFAVGELGHQGVVVFFAMSGFLVGGPLLEKWRASAPLKMPDYTVRRLSRLLLVLIPALILTVLFDRIGYRVLGIEAPYLAYRDFAEANKVSTFIGNLFFLQEIFVPPFGSNGPLWSLSYEFWYYFLFPAILITTYPKSSVKTRVLSGICAVVIAYFLFPKILIYFGIWLVGAGARLYQPRKLPLPLFVYLAQFGFILFLTRAFLRAAHNDTWVEFAWDYLVTASFCLAIFKIRSQSESKQIPLHKVHSLLAESSYTLYLFHLPFLNLLVCVLLKIGWIGSLDEQPTLYMWSVMGMAIILIYGYSLLSYYLIERHTKTVQKWALGRFCPKGKAN